MVSVAELKQEIAGARDEFLVALAEARPKDWGEPTPNEGWSLRDLLAHVASAQSGFARVFQLIHEGQYRRPADWDENRWNAAQLQKRAGKSVDELRQEMDESWRQLVAAIELLTDGQLLSTFPPDPRTVEQMLRNVANHYREHREDVRGTLERR